MTIDDVRSHITFHPRFAPQMLYSDPHMKLVLACLEPGQTIPAHREDNQAVFFVVDGSGAILTDDGDQAVAAGGIVTVPLGGTRGMRATTERFVVLATALIP
jgi:quercetin dioxygenase-like cupin family protein